MKKNFSAAIFCIAFVLILSLTSCNGNNGETYYPQSDEIKTNLEHSGYAVAVTNDLGGKSGTYLSTTKNSEYIFFIGLITSPKPTRWGV